jgi:FixJ family two-component response regulator
MRAARSLERTTLGAGPCTIRQMVATYRLVGRPTAGTQDQGFPPAIPMQMPVLSAADRVHARVAGRPARGFVDAARVDSAFSRSSGPDMSCIAAAPPLIHVVDDDQSFRTAVGRMLRTCDFAVALYESADQLLDKPLRAERGCILLDVQMAGLDGLETQDRLARLGNALPIIFLTGHGDIPTSVRAIKAGAEDFLSKPVSAAALREAIGRALERYDANREQRRQLDALRARVAALTPRESEVFNLMVRGNLNKQIAHSLGTSERTVKAHRHKVMEKLQVRSIAEAVSIAERLGMLASR